MKKDLHPEYFEDAKIKCACGASYDIGSTVKEIHVELCAACHPFYTGEKQKIIDTARRVEKFQERMSKKSAKPVTGKKVKKEKRAATRKAKQAQADETKPRAKKAAVKSSAGGGEK
jgi:large subunit ribosomal protein L31